MELRTLTSGSPKKTSRRCWKRVKAEPHRFAPQAGWVTFRISAEGDVEAAKELIRLSHNNAEKRMVAHPLRRFKKEPVVSSSGALRFARRSNRLNRNSYISCLTSVR